MRNLVFTIAILIFISACAHQSPSYQNTTQNVYKVKLGESMQSIANSLNIPYELLTRSNPWLDPVRIKPEMKLVIPSDAVVSQHQSELNYSSRQAENMHGHIWPLKKISVSSPYGTRNGRMHKGIDLRAPRGTPILTTDDGVVIFSGVKGGYGKLVVIDHGYDIHTVYAHNSQNLVRKGQRVKQGETIAKVGRTGKATGHHVHYEFRRDGKAVNPTHTIQAGL